jgi:hypothetical protein
MLMKFRPREPEACFGRNSAISDCPFHFWSASLISTCIESFNLVVKQWDFNALQIGLCFVSVVVGYLVARCDVSSRYCTPASHSTTRWKRGSLSRATPLASFVYCASGGNWPVWLRVDLDGPRVHALGCTVGVHLPPCHCQPRELRDLPGLPHPCIVILMGDSTGSGRAPSWAI